MGTYVVREDGENAEIAVLDDRIVRTRVGPHGREEIGTIPVAAVKGVSHHRHVLASDEVTLQVGMVEYRWKVRDAEEMLAELHRIRFVTGALSDPARDAATYY